MSVHSLQTSDCWSSSDQCGCYATSACEGPDLFIAAVNVVVILLMEVVNYLDASSIKGKMVADLWGAETSEPLNCVEGLRLVVCKPLYVLSLVEAAETAAHAGDGTSDRRSMGLVDMVFVDPGYNVPNFISLLAFSLSVLLRLQSRPHAVAPFRSVSCPSSRTSHPHRLVRCPHFALIILA
jgi:hypothetical protein